MSQPREILEKANFCTDRSTISGKAGIEVNGSYKEINASNLFELLLYSFFRTIKNGAILNKMLNLYSHKKSKFFDTHI